MLQPNTLLQQRYQIIEQIGRGGMGAVYKATDIRLRSIVALKQTLVEGEPARRAFEREAQLLASLRHPNLPRVSDHFLEDDGQFLVMEFIPGDDLATLLANRDTPFTTAEVLRWNSQLLDALEYLHSQQPPIIHRDIKPQNIKLTERGEIILLDFGLAKGSNVQVTRLSTSGSIFGYTPHYAPLEQIQGSGTSERSDLYSLAATMHHLLSGTPPPDALTRAAAKINDEPDPLLPINQLNPSVPAAVAVIFNNALSQRPDQRPASATAMRAALQNASMVTNRLVDPNNSAGMATIVEGATIPSQHMVFVAPSQAEAQSHATSASSQALTNAPLADHTTIPPHQTTTAQPRDNKRWLWLGLMMMVLFFGAIGAVIAINEESQVASPPSNPGNVPPVADASPEPTNTAAPTVDILVAAAGTQTAIAETQEAVLATARVVLNATDFAATETAIALTPTMTPPPTEAPTAEPTAEPTTAPAPTSAPAAVGSPKPTPLPRPTSPATSTPAPTNTPTPTSGPSGSVISTGGGSMFRGSANLGETSPEAGAGGTCIEGKVSTMDGGLFSSFGVQVDMRGNTRQATANFNTGTYRACGLAAGEWGISIFMAGGVNIPGPEQAAHQVRVMATGTPGEIFYVNFSALPGLVVPTPTPEPITSPYDGIWRGTNSGTTTTGEYPPGRFEIEVRNGLIYRISVDGPSCPFETYPNGAKGAPINGNAFAVAGSVYNPITGENGGIQVQISGVFSSASSASGTLNAQQNGVACATATWGAGR